ncbi:MAG: serine/threonine protein kinase, partial [Longispora sp.]|nr:serine/threonine protein kinase [Longispora sp. (in: high G+C Gram-positive bacteria)]
ITTIAGNGQDTFSGDGGAAVNASLNYFRSITVDAAGNILVTDTDNHRIRRIDAATQIITTIAGNGQDTSGGDDGRATNASLSYPTGIAVDATGRIFVADPGHHTDRVNRIHRFGPLN